MTRTENGAATYGTAGSDCLDLFATVGALRRESSEEIIARFIRAYTENADLAMKLLFFARDIRGGLGERRVFRTIFTWLAKHEPNSVIKNMKYVAEYGRFDDLLSLLDTPCEAEMLSFLKVQFDADMAKLEDQSVSLLGKWLPSVNASNGQTVRNAKKIAKAFGLNDAAYRKAVTALRAKICIIENNLREKDYTFDYEKQPSRAMFKYKKAFARNDRERYNAFLSKAISGEATLHAGNISPYELVEPYLITGWYWNQKSFMRDITPAEKVVLNATWGSMPDFGGDENAIAVIDTSGSMYCGPKPLPAAVALSLGLYFAEHNKGVFRNHFIEFSARPQLIEIKGDTFADRLRYVTTFNEVADTNLEAVFDLILNAAVKNRISQEELPAKLIIISDMEFNACVRNASAVNFKNAQKKYEDCGYRLPEIVFWNVASRNRQQPVTMNEQGVALISGATPRIFSMVAGGNLSPYTFMREVLESERYAPIVA
ncbi:DUF2828 family protein [Hominifimenecus sp. rT4P-3]|uniref:DUF2828 family protein n=1 Tax=Hominifimenecus sp. rT4P-3 TaxID=3242979 RepID=UPI003DA26B77